MTEREIPEEEEEVRTLTPLQQDIKEAIEQNASLDDQQIAKIVFIKKHPSEEWQNKAPTWQYVQKFRRRLEFLSKPPEIKVEKPEKVELPEGEAPEEKPLEKEFEIPTIEVKPEEKPPEEKLEREDISFIVSFTFDKIADWTDYQGWRLDPQNKNDQRFLDLSAKMIDKYLPDILEKYSLEVVFGYVAIMTVAPRIKGWRQQKKAKEPIIKPEEEKPAQVEKKPEAPKEAPAEETKGAADLLRRLV